jgi:hypothetical protein
MTFQNGGSSTSVHAIVRRPNPGSDEALKQGCKCPVMDNGYGRGYMGQPNQFIQVHGCPVHGP